MESDEKTRIDVPDAAIAIISSNEYTASLSNSTTLSTSTSLLSDNTRDLETGFFDCSSDKNNYNLNDYNDEEENKQADFSYTHVLLPSPGFGLDGTCMETLLGKNNEEEEEKSSGKSNSGIGSSGKGGEVESGSWTHSVQDELRKNMVVVNHRQTKDNSSSSSNLNRSSDDNGDSTASKGTLDTALVHSDIEEAASSSSSSSSDLQAKQQRDHEYHHHHYRQVPIFCSICLSEYELSQSICWSNNHQCTHAFHTECMIQWLVTLGRKQSLNKRFTRYPKDELQCPCCRQEFVRSDFIEKECCV